MPANKQNSVINLKTFQFLWCLFILAHHAITAGNWTKIGNGWLESQNYFFLSIGFGTAVSLICSIVLPKKLWLFGLTLVLWTILKLGNMPFVPNHIIFALIINLTVLSGILLYYSQLRKIENKLSLEKFYKTIAPILRIMLIILYFFTVFHKINTDYFNPVISCGVVLYEEITNFFTMLPSNNMIYWLVIIGTLAVEALIPVLLIIRNTRIYGIVLGLVFHLSLALHANLMILSFTFELIALFSLFLPQKAFVQIASKVRFAFKALFPASRGYLNRNMLYLFIGNILIVALIFVFKPMPGVPPNQQQVIVFYLFMLGLLFLISAIAYSISNKQGKFQSSFFKVPNTLFLVFPVILLFNGFSPYLGLKTATNFSMFSNLQIKNNYSNHLLLPNTLDLLDHSNILAEIVKTNYPPFQEIDDNNELIPLFELQRIVERFDEIDTYYVDYQIGERMFHENFKDANDNSWDLEKKFLIYRTVAKQGPCSCQW